MAAEKERKEEKKEGRKEGKERNRNGNGSKKWMGTKELQLDFLHFFLFLSIVRFPNFLKFNRLKVLINQQKCEIKVVINKKSSKSIKKF